MHVGERAYDIYTCTVGGRGGRGGCVHVGERAYDIYTCTVDLA